MGNKRTKVKKPKKNMQKMSGQKGGSMASDVMGAPSPVRKQKKK